MAVSFAAKIRALFRDRPDLDKPERIQARSVFVFGMAGAFEFNGVDPFGVLDPTAMVVKTNATI